MTIFESEILATAPLVRGSGGGGKSGGGGGSATEDPNTLQSKQTARLIDLLGEGEIVGLVNGARSIYLNNTPLEASDGSFNFKGVTWAARVGLPDQTHIEGFPATETEVVHGGEVKSDLPITVTITDPAVNAARVAVSVSALTEQNPSTGDLHGSSVQIAIDVRSNGGGWDTRVTDTIGGKTTSAYERGYRVELPRGGAPWDVRVRRLTPDAKTVNIQNRTYFSHYAEIIDGKFSYPDSALVALTVDAQQFGDQIPTRSYDVKGLKVRVPINYDPETRAYSGLWDGSFKLAWTNNPAWVLYDLLTHARYGLGDVIASAQVDKWSLYQIAQYCDQLIPDGRGGMEPRFTFDGAIAGREDAYVVLQAVCSVFRGMAYWAAGSVFAKSDMPGDPVKLVSPANVIDGSFAYSGTALKARHTVALVSWNDPEDGFKPAIEVVENPELIAKWGWRPVEFTAYGCSRRSQARRMGLWVLDSEEHETETVTYQASFDHADLTPGDLISVADPSYSNARFGGRLVGTGGAGLSLHLDAPVDLAAGHSYTISVVLPNGAINTRAILNGAGTHSQVSVGALFDITPEANAMWVITGSDLAPRLFRVRSVRELEPNAYEVVALRHDPTKYARIEQGLYLTEPPYTRPTGEVPAPEGFTGHETRYLRNGVPRSRVSLGWSAPSYQFLSGYRLLITAPSGAVEMVNTTTTAYDVVDAEVGTYRFELRTVAWNGTLSRPVGLEVAATGWEEIPGLYVSHLQVDGQGSDTTFRTRDPIFTWRGNFPDTSWEPGAEPAAGAGRVDPRFRDYVVRIIDPATRVTLRTDYTTSPSFQYFLEMNRVDSARLGRSTARRRFIVAVSIRDTLWRESRINEIEVYNPAPALPKNLRIGPTIGLIQVIFDPCDDPDFAGTMVWRDTVRDFALTPDKAVANGRDTAFLIPSDPNTAYWVRVGHYDAFGPDEINVTDPVFVRAGYVVDTTPPPRPEPPVLTTSMGADGKPRLVATWTASPATDFARWELAIKRTEEAQNQWQFVTTSALATAWVVDPAVSYDVKLRAVDVSGNESPYSEVATLVTARDDVPPAAVTELAAEASFRAIWLSWTNPADADYAYAAIFEGETDILEDASRIGTQPGLPDAQSVLTRSGLEPGVTRHYWVQSFDSSGNAGPVAGPVEQTSASLSLPDFPEDFGPIPMVPALPLEGPSSGVQYVFNTTDSKLYKWDAEAAEWRPAFNFSEIEGEITELQISEDAVKAKHIAANEILGKHIKGKEIEAEHLGAESVTAGAIKAGAVTATHMAAEKVITLGAQIGEAIIDDAHIVELDAKKIKANTVLAGSVMVGTSALSDIADNANADPAARINQGSTQIDPGKVVIAGSKTLADWRAGPNSTEINGGAVAANTIATNKLFVGARGLSVYGIEFAPASAQSSTMTWTAGWIVYINDAGNPEGIEIAAGATTLAYVYWTKGARSLEATNDAGLAVSGDRVHMATNHGAGFVIAHYGGLRLDGSRMVAGSILADSVAAGAIRANHIGAGEISAGHLATNTAIITSNKQLALKVIGGAQIDHLAVDTLHIAGNAITVPSANYAPGDIHLNGDWQWVVPCWHVAPDLGKIHINATAIIGGTRGTVFNHGFIDYKLCRYKLLDPNGPVLSGETELAGGRALEQPSAYQYWSEIVVPAAFAITDQPGPGTFLYTLSMRNPLYPQFQGPHIMYARNRAINIMQVRK